MVPQHGALGGGTGRCIPWCDVSSGILENNVYADLRLRASHNPRDPSQSLVPLLCIDCLRLRLLVGRLGPVVVHVERTITRNESSPRRSFKHCSCSFVGPATSLNARGSRTPPVVHIQLYERGMGLSWSEEVFKYRSIG